VIRVLCTGSRTFTAEGPIAFELDKIRRGLMFEDPITVVHGDCKTGADAIVDRVARQYGYTVETHPADWEKHGKAAGPIRNGVMTLLGADLCLAFWDGFSRGTLDCITQAVKTGIPVRIIPPRAPDRARAGRD